MSPTASKNHKQREVLWQQYHLRLAVAEYQIIGGKHSSHVKKKGIGVVTSCLPRFLPLPGWSSVVPALAALLCLLYFLSGFSTLVISGVLRCLLTFLGPSSVCERDVQEELQPSLAVRCQRDPCRMSQASTIAASSQA